MNIIKKGQNPCEVTELKPIFFSLLLLLSMALLLPREMMEKLDPEVSLENL